MNYGSFNQKYLFSQNFVNKYTDFSGGLQSAILFCPMLNTVM
jgi:hypothetical protein